MTPFRILYGRDPSLLVQYGSGLSLVASMDHQLEEQVAMLDLLKQNLLRAQQKMKSAADKKRKDEQFSVGGLVYLILQPYRRKSLAQHHNEKLAPRFYGPYEVEAQIGAVAYHLCLPASTMIHPVFHVSQLRRVVGQCHTTSSLPPQLNIDLELAEPAELLGVRRCVQRSNTELEVLIRWAHLSPHDDTWELYDVITTQFPHFHLEDEVKLWAGGSDRAPIRLMLVKGEATRVANFNPVLELTEGSENTEQAELAESEEEKQTKLTRGKGNDELAKAVMTEA